jgi:hypothetical protein
LLCGFLAAAHAIGYADAAVAVAGESESGKLLVEALNADSGVLSEMGKFQQWSQASFELMKDGDSLQDVWTVRISKLAFWFGIELEGNVDVVLAAKPWGVFLADFDQIVPARPDSAHMLASEIRNTAHLPDPYSSSLKMSLDLLASHSGFQCRGVSS